MSFFLIIHGFVSSFNSFLTSSLSLSVYIYIYVCVCVCVYDHHYQVVLIGMSSLTLSPSLSLSVGWGCIIHRVLFCRRERPHPHECPDTKHSDGEVPVTLELWGMRITSLLPSLPEPLWHGVVAPDRVLSMGQIEFNCVYLC